MTKINFKRLNDQATLPTQAHTTDAGVDFYAPHDIFLSVGGKQKVLTGLAVEIPVGWAGMVYPRSSMGAKHDVVLANTVGIIDAGYRGEIVVVLRNFGDKPYAIRKGDRFAQMLVTPVLMVEPVEVAELSESVRGVGGFGSSGK